MLGGEGWEKGGDTRFEEGLFHAAEVRGVGGRGRAEIETEAAVDLDIDEAGGHYAVLEVDGVDW